MKINKLIILLSICLACNQKEKAVSIDLPFYNDETWSAQWIEPGSSEYDNIHQIRDFKFINQEGDSISNKDFEGKIYVANFFFTACPTVCPKMEKNLSFVQDAFKDEDRVKILSHSVMPWADSVRRLKEYAVRNNIDSDKWFLVTGEQEELYSIGRLDYFADEGFGKGLTDISDFLHTENIILVDQKRRIRGIYNGTLKLEMKRMVEDMRLLL